MNRRAFVVATVAALLCGDPPRAKGPQVEWWDPVQQRWRPVHGATWLPDELGIRLPAARSA